MAMHRWTVRGCQIFPAEQKSVSLLADVIPTSCYPQSSCFSCPSFRFHHAVCKAIQQKMTPTPLPAELITTHLSYLSYYNLRFQLILSKLQRAVCNMLGQIKDPHKKNQVFDRRCPREEKKPHKIYKYRVLFLRHTLLSSSNIERRLSKWEVVLTSLQ